MTKHEDLKLYTDKTCLINLFRGGLQAKWHLVYKIAF